MKELVSIIMPSFNTGSVIHKSIESVLSQTYTNWELIIVDDCSSDNTEEIVRKYLYDTRIIFIKNNKNMGAAGSRNRALSIARGKWIAFLDSDDLWKSEKLYKQIRFMKKNRVYFSYTAYSEMDEHGRLTGTVVYGPRKITRNGFLNYCWPGCLTVMYDREHIGLIQINDIKKNNDYAMWLEVSKKATCYFFNQNLAYYRRGRKGSISSHGVMTMIKWHYKLFRNNEKQSVVLALINSTKNIFFGVIKKIVYIRRVKG